MQNIQQLDKNYSALTQDELFDVTGGLVIVIAGVSLIITAKGIAMAAAIIAGVYSVGYALGQGWAYVKK